METDSQKLDRILELVERNTAGIAGLTRAVDKNTTDIEALTSTVSKLATTVETGFSAVAEDISALNDKVEMLQDKADENHAELRGKLAGLERRLDAEAVERQDLQLPQRVAAIETHLGIPRSLPA